MSAVLIVEAEAGLREGLCSVVQAMGHEALAAAGLGEARALLATHAPDCILLDIRLRDGDGLDYLRELRGGPRRDVPVVMVTAYSSHHLDAEVAARPFLALRRKPVQYEELARMLPPA